MSVLVILSDTEKINMATADSEPTANPNESDVPSEQQAPIETLKAPFPRDSQTP